MDRRPVYIVRGSAKGGTVTYNCPSPEWAVRKHRDLTQRDLVNVMITGPDGQTLTLTELEGMADEGAVPAASVPARRP